MTVVQVCYTLLDINHHSCRSSPGVPMTNDHHVALTTSHSKDDEVIFELLIYNIKFHI